MAEKLTYDELEQRVKELSYLVSEGKRVQVMTEEAKKIHDIFLLSPFGVFLIDLSGKIIASNKMGAKRLGKNSQEIVGTILRDYFPSNIAEKRKFKGIEAIRSGNTQRIEDQVEGKWYSSTIIPLKDKNGKITSLAIYGVDVTEIKKARIEQERLLSELRAALEAAVVGIIIVDLDGKISSYSKRFVKMWNMPVSILDSEDANQALFHILDQIERPETFLEKVKTLFTLPNAKGSDNLYLKDGRVFEFNSRPQQLNDKPVGRVWSFRDATMQEQAKKNLLDSERRLQALSDAPFETIFFSEKGVCIDQNSTAEKMFGYSCEEAVGRRGTEWIIPEDREIVKHNMLTGYKKPYEVTALRKDGTIFPAEIQGRMFDYMGKSIRVTALRDISDRKRAEEALRESEKRWQNIIENAAIGIYQVTDQGIFEMVNPALANIFGYRSPDEFLTNVKNISELYLRPEDRAPILHEMYLKGYVDGAEAQFKHKEGKTIWIKINARIIRDAPGEITYEGFMADITDVKQAQEDLHKSEQWMQNIFKSLNEAVFVITPDRKFLDMNKTALKMFGYEKKELLNQSAEVVHVDREHYRKFGKKIEEVIKNGTLNDYQFKMRRKNGDIFPSEHSASLILDNEGKPIGIASVIRDLTKQKQAEEENKRLQIQLIQSQKMESIGNLAGGIAHDFNNILSSIIGFTELALEDVPKETPLEENLQEVYTAGIRAKDLVKQILAFARQSDEERKPIQVDSIAKEVLKLMRSTIPTTIEIREIIESHSLIMGNPSQVHQLFMNLCTNAAQAMEGTGGILDFAMSDVENNDQSPLSESGLKSGNYLKVTVSDTGPGISADIIDSIFEPYFTTKGVGEGTGMGLALAHGIVESYGGKITIDNDLGNGTAFSIYLPITKGHEGYRRYEEEELPSGTERILFVDDELPIARMSGHVLERLGYRVTVRTSSVEALELFRSKPNDFDLVISDMTMPNMTGDELAMYLISIRSDIPIILCTGYSKKITDESAAKIGIKAFAYKPIVKADLAKTVRKVLDEVKG